MVVAIYHFHAKVVSRSKGKSAVGRAAYISGERIKDEYNNVNHDYTRKKEIVHKEILLPDNAPQDFLNRRKLWNAAELAEKRKNSQTARDIEAALPRELDLKTQIDLVQNFCKQCFVAKGMCVDFAIHDKGDGNPHVHILLPTRNVDKSGFTTKNRSWNDKALLLEWRECWADWCNHKLHFVSNEKIDHRSYREQGIDKIPQLHLGAAVHAIEKKGFLTDKGKRNRKIRLDNFDMEIAEIQNNIASVKAERRGNLTEIINGALNGDEGAKHKMLINDCNREQFEKYLQEQNVPVFIAYDKNSNPIAIFRERDSEIVNRAYHQAKKEVQVVTETLTSDVQQKSNTIKKRHLR